MRCRTQPMVCTQCASGYLLNSGDNLCYASCPSGSEERIIGGVAACAGMLLLLLLLSCSSVVVASSYFVVNALGLGIFEFFLA